MSRNEIRWLDFRFHPLKKAELIALLVDGCRARNRVILASANVHGLWTFFRNHEYAALHNRPGTVVMIDGMPVIWLLRVLGYPLTIADRTTWVDWFDDFLQQLNSRRLSMFILGHTAETLSRGIRLIEQRWPDIRISGHHGYFDIAETSEQNLAIIDTINAFNPDVLLIGMGMPRQEIWAHRYSARLGVPVIALGGAALDYFAAIIPTPPRWIGRLGFEWLYRLGCDPRRMAPRYLLEPMGLIYLICRRLIARRPGV